VLQEDTGLDSFEKALTGRIRKRSFRSYVLLQFQNQLGSILTLVISMLVIFFLALLSIHGSLSYDLFSGGESSNIFNFRGIYLYLLLSLFMLLFLVFSPRIILGDYDNLFEWANKRFSTGSRIKRRLSRGIGLLFRLHKEQKTIVLWNPMIAGPDSWARSYLVPALSMTDAEIEVMVRVDDRENVLQLISENNTDIRFANKPIHAGDADMQAYPFEFLSVWEKECFHCLLFSSTINLPEAWTADGPAMDTIVSKELAEAVYHQYESKLSSGGAAGISFEKFLNRCIIDYGYLEQRSDTGMQEFLLVHSIPENERMPAVLESIADTVTNNIGAVSGKLKDPLALVILLALTRTDQDLDARKIDLVQDFVRNVKRTEKYWLMNRYWAHISAKNRVVEGEYKLGILQFMDVGTLKDLSACFVNAGMYADAFEVFGILENIYPARIAIEIADLKDSMGEYREALEILLKTDEEWVKSGMIDDRTLILELYLNIAWVIVSGRFEEHREEGYEYLGKTDNILRKLPNTEDYILFLTRYYNTKANYHEWERNYDLAIENYEKALKLPGTILRKSSLLSNRGIAERLLGKATDDISARRKHLLASRANIRQAVNMKKSIGEKNQIPGSSHNLAETLLELSSVMDEKEEKLSILQEANDVTAAALSILDELNSQKRRGRLLTERFIAHKLLSDLGEKSEKELIEPKLRSWLQAEDKTSYDYRETTQLLQRFGIDMP
jgi:tetratricopeptide (TPR) repeat protein